MGDGYERFEAQVRQYQHRIFGFACYFLNDREEAADVTQDVLLRLWTHRHEVDADRALGWLLRVTRNACVDALRKRKVQRDVMTVDTDGLPQAPTDGPSPVDTTEAADFQRHLQRALAELSEPYRSIVILREVDGLKYEEISGAMDLPLGTVKVYLHRGRKMLRTALNKVIPHEIV